MQVTATLKTSSGYHHKNPLLLLWTILGVFLLLGFINLLLPYFPEPVGSRSHLFVEGTILTLELSLGAGALGLLIGIFLGIAKLSRNIFLYHFAWFWIWILRGTPLLTQILFVYYAVPLIFPALKLGEFNSALIALALNVGAYNAEVVRAGILAVPKGQFETALSLGLSRFQVIQWVVFPQAFKVMFPSLVNNFIALIKDSSLASCIGLLELSLAGNRISSETFQPFPILVTVAFIYLLLTSLMSGITYLYEKSLHGRRKLFET